MGFFSELKEDLSQAVTELMPDEENVQQDAEQEQEVSLEEMLQNLDLDEAVLAEETPLEQEITEDVVEEMQSVQEEEPQPVVEENKAEENKGAERPMESHANRVAADETSIITQGMIITGDLVAEGSIDVIGVVNGNIDALGKLNVTGHINGNSRSSEIYAEGAKINGEIVSDGAVKIGASTVVIGNISATSAVIAGAVKGDIDVHGPVILDASAIVMGNIRSKSVQINNGAVIEGMCSQCYADISPTSFFDDYKPEVKKGRK